MTDRIATLFERLGGEPAVEAVVENFYTRVMEDSRINHFFAGIDMKKQREHQIAFLRFTFGGSSYYRGLSLRNAHQNLVEEFGLRDEHFNAVFEHLVSTLKDLRVREDLIKEVGENLESIRSYILNK